MNGPGDILCAAAARYGDRTGLITSARTLSFTELSELADRVAADLAARGVQAGQTVSLYAQNRWEWIASYHGALRAGAAVNPVNAMLTTDEQAFVLRDCAAVALLAGSAQAAHVAGIAADPPDLTTVVAFGEQGKSQTHISTTGFNDGDHVTISAALSGGFWSMRTAPSLKAWRDWCDVHGAKLLDTSIDLSKVLNGFIVPKDLTERPPFVLLGAEWGWQFFTGAGPHHRRRQASRAPLRPSPIRPGTDDIARLAEG